MNDNDDFRFDSPDTSHLAPIWRPLPAKLRAYEAVYLLNRSFHATLVTLERMERMGVFGVHYLNETKIRLEVLRCDLGEDLAMALQELEENDTARFAKMQRYLDRQHRDPDDVFLQAEERRQEIRDQIKELQRGLGKDKDDDAKAKAKRKSK